jgi:ribonuclease P protein component
MATFRKHEHLLTPRQFQEVYDRRRSASDAGLIVYGRENGLAYTRVGLSVSRKYGGAVQRNRLRRLYREAFRLSKEQIPVGMDLVLIPRSQEEPVLEALQKSLVKLASQVQKKMLKDAAAEPKREAGPE